MAENNGMTVVETRTTETQQPVVKKNILQTVGDWFATADPWKKILVGVGTALGAAGAAWGISKVCGGRRDDEDDDDPYFDEGPGSDDYSD